MDIAAILSNLSDLVPIIRGIVIVGLVIAGSFVVIHAIDRFLPAK